MSATECTPCLLGSTTVSSLLQRMRRTPMQQKLQCPHLSSI
ncbi:MAG: hypothetical protein IIY97_05145 [Firmicutes bacterium]|nr:hypothetical protein [Bacillota bacterium]